MLDDVDGGKEGVSGDNGVKKSVDGGKDGCIGPHIIPYLNLVSPYFPHDRPLPQPVYLIPFLLQHPLKIGEGFRGTHHREKAFEGDQELYQLLLIRKRPLLAIYAARE